MCIRDSCYTQNSIISVRRRPDEDEDKKVIREIGRKIIALTAEADAYTGEERNQFMRDKLTEIERDYA